MPPRKGILNGKLHVVNLGLSVFAEDLKAQGVDVIEVDWKPPAGGDEEILRLLDKLGS